MSYRSDLRPTIGLQRYAYESYAIPLEFPSWDWDNSKEETVYLKLARVLTVVANERAAQQPFDGSIGLAVPGCVHSCERFFTQVVTTVP